MSLASLSPFGSIPSNVSTPPALLSTRATLTDPPSSPLNSGTDSKTGKTTRSPGQSHTLQLHRSDPIGASTKVPRTSDLDDPSNVAPQARSSASRTSATSMVSRHPSKQATRDFGVGLDEADFLPQSSSHDRGSLASTPQALNTNLSGAHVSRRPSTSASAKKAISPAIPFSPWLGSDGHGFPDYSIDEPDAEHLLDVDLSPGPNLTQSQSPSSSASFASSSSACQSSCWLTHMDGTNKLGRRLRRRKSKVWESKCSQLDLGFNTTNQQPLGAVDPSAAPQPEAGDAQPSTTSVPTYPWTHDHTTTIAIDDLPSSADEDDALGTSPTRVRWLKF